jgi:hypothetical protein
VTLVVLGGRDASVSPAHDMQPVRTCPEFVTLLTRQRNDAAKRGDPTKATLFDQLIHGIDTPA